MIANCGALGLNWREQDLSSYLEAMEAHNEMQAPKEAGKATPEQLERLRRALKAHEG